MTANLADGVVGVKRAGKRRSRISLVAEQLIAHSRCGETDGAGQVRQSRGPVNGVFMPTRFAHACFGVWIVALAAAFYTVPQFSMFTWAAIGLSSAAAVLLGIRLHRPSRRLPWVLLSGVLVSFTAGDTVYNIITDYLGTENPFPSAADVFYLAVYPMLAAALLILIRARSGGDNRAALLDALLPTAGLGLLSWVFLIAPYVRDTGLTLPEKLTSASYPLGDVLALAMLLRLFTVSGRKPTSITILAAGVTGLLVTDVLYGLRQLAGTWEVGGPTDAGWVFFYAAIGFSALHPSMTRLTPVMELSPVVTEAGGKRIVLMSVTSLIGPTVLLLQDVRGEVHDAPVIAAACALMFLLVMARVSGLLSTQRQAGARERALRRAGAMLVAAASVHDAEQALRGAVAELVPEGQPYQLHLVGDDMTANEVSGVDHHATMVRVDSLPPAIAAQLAGFAFALRTAVVGAARNAGGPVRRMHAYLATTPATLGFLRPSFDALMSQAAMAIERITLTDEVNRRSSEDYFRTLIRSTSDVILIIDDDEQIRYASPSATGVFGWPDLVGAPLTGLIAGTDHALLQDLLTRTRTGHGHHEGTDLTAVRVDRRPLQVECTCRDLREDPTVAGLVLTIRDVTERRQLENDLTYQAFHDGLTGLANRLRFQNRLEHAAQLAQNDASTIGVLFIDLDDFKEVNDTLGHAVGDRLLVAVGQRIAWAIGPSDLAARMGGDEFAVLIEDAQCPADADEVAARIVAALAQPFEVSDGSGGTHVVSGAGSVGVATNLEASGTTELQRQADLALYVAKAEGKKKWQRYQSGLHNAVRKRLELRSALNEAVARGELVVQYQPIVDLPTEAGVGVEALVRWQHPTRGLLGPDEFIQHAEENGAIVGIGQWVLREALRTFVGWRAAGPDSALTYVSVNVSARQFHTPGFVDEVRTALADTGAEPQSLLVEITESLVLRDAKKVWAELQELRELGVRIAIDDFGTGYSSLSYLRQMPVDVLKIDKSFIDDILYSDEQLALVEAIISLARTLKLAVVAEGIEDQAHRRKLIQMGCPYGQGYLFSKPMSAAEVMHRLAPQVLVS
jgi:diguanylate cyclase (GGDEF)-like protein/PAS domain S-box-containing protein